jgi:hypothetical protein
MEKEIFMKLKWFSSPTFWGIVLILAGILFLLQNMGILPAGSIFIGVATGFFGVLFLATYWGNREQWWALIPGFILISLSCLLLMDAFFPGASSTWGGPVFLAGMGLSFWAVYFVRHEHWWAIIPGGVLMTLGGVAALDAYGRANSDSGAAFFLGIGLTFLLVAILPNPTGKMNWAYIPASVLGLIGIFMLAFTANLAIYIMPALIIVLGVALLMRALRR